jgi:CheY-like chemotaxis protein
LPKATTAAAPVTKLQPSTELAEQVPSPVRRYTILVVDDDPLVLTIAAEMLQDLGHTAVEAISGRQALEILRAGAQADMVITDYSMPGMTGVRLAAELQRLRPRLPVVLATGYAERAEVMDSGLPVIAKPFDQAALAKVVTQWLTASINHAQVIPFRSQFSGRSGL